MMGKKNLLVDELVYSQLGSKLQTHFSLIEVRNKEYSAVIAPLTSNTFILIVADVSVRKHSFWFNLTSFVRMCHALCSF
jgi:hypothetical protein